MHGNTEFYIDDACKKSLHLPFRFDQKVTGRGNIDIEHELSRLDSFTRKPKFDDTLEKLLHVSFKFDRYLITRGYQEFKHVLSRLEILATIPELD